MSELNGTPESMEETIDVTKEAERIAYVIEEMIKYVRKDGIKKGNVNTAKKMIAAGIDVKIIAECTELTEDEINKLMN